MLTKRVKGYAVLFASLLFSVAATAQARSTVMIRLIDTLSTGSSQPGDTFTGTLATPLVVGDRIVAEKDARVIGQVREVVSSGRLKRPALITLNLNVVERPHGRVPLQTGDLTVKAGSHAAPNLVIIGGSVGAGSIIGAAAGGRKGAAIGAATGAGAGVITAYLTGKREIVLSSETLLAFHVTSVTISQAELARLQRVGHQEDYRPSLRYRRHHRHHHEHNDDDDDDDHDDD